MSKIKKYSPSTTTKIAGLVMALVPALIGLLFIYVGIYNYIRFHHGYDDFLPILMVGIPFLGIGVLLYNYSFTYISIESDVLIFNRPLTKNSEYNLKDLEEITWFLIPTPQKTMPSGTPQGTGRAIGNGLLGLASRSTKNAQPGTQFLAKYSDGRTFYIKTNFINYSNNLIAEIEKISGLKCLMITSQEYSAWKNGELDTYRQDPDKKKREFVKKLSPFIKAKYLLYLPIGLFLLSLLFINILFNISQLQYFKMLQKQYSHDFITYKDSPKALHSKILVDDAVDFFLVGKTQPILHDVVVNPVFCHNKKDDETEQFHYYFFPYEEPDCYSFLINLDEDELPEIIYREEIARYRYEWRVYDFDTSKQQFISKPIESFSYLVKFYVDVVSSSFAPAWKYKYFYSLGYFLPYLLIVGFALYQFNKLKKSLMRMSKV